VLFWASQRMTTRPPKAPFDTPPGWQRVKELFHLALERDPATRGAYLDQARRFMLAAKASF
jgi:hypothetical protein